MTSVELVDTVLAVMAAQNVSQSGLARECGLTQPHLSRVLNKRLKLARKTRLKLEAWVVASTPETLPGAAPEPTLEDLQKLVRRLGGSKTRRMQIMHLLRAVEALLIASDPTPETPSQA